MPLRAKALAVAISERVVWYTAGAACFTSIVDSLPQRIAALEPVRRLQQFAS